MATSSRLKRSAKAVKAVFTRGCEPSASTHASAVSHQLGNRGGACTFYTVLLSQESSTAGGRRFGENSSLLHASRTLPRPSYQAWSGASWSLRRARQGSLLGQRFHDLNHIRLPRRAYMTKCG